MPAHNYEQRDILDKLGIKPGQRIATEQIGHAIEPELLQRISERSGSAPNTELEYLDIVLASIDETANAVEVLTRWRPRLVPSGGIWLLTPKRTQPGYVDQRALINAGQLAGLVDNKICSLSATTSAMRFVIRKQERPG